MTDLKAAIRQALARSSSQRPVDTEILFTLGARKKIESDLLEMYQQHDVCCCLVTRNGQQKSAWWLATPHPHNYGRTGRGIL